MTTGGDSDSCGVIAAVAFMAPDTMLMGPRSPQSVPRREPRAHSGQRRLLEPGAMHAVEPPLQSRVVCHEKRALGGVVGSTETRRPPRHVLRYLSQRALESSRSTE